MTKPEKTLVEIKVNSEDKRAVTKIKRIIQDYLLTGGNYYLADKFEFSPEKGDPGKHWVTLQIIKVNRAIANESDGGDYGEN